MIVFKYMPPKHVCQALANGELLARPPQELNDPYELHFRLKPCSPVDVLRALNTDSRIRRRLIEYGKVPAALPPKKLREAAVKICKKMEDEREDILEIPKRPARLVCFAGTHDSLLMWSHYAAAHTGVVLEFDATEWLIAPRPMRYSRDLPEFDFLAEDAEMLSAIDDIVLTKSRSWRYEQESRLVLDGKTETRERVVVGKRMDFWPFPRESLKRVRVGARCEIANQIVEALYGLKEYSAVVVEQASLHETRYEVRFDPLS